jgi:hypothetical protein
MDPKKEEWIQGLLLCGYYYGPWVPIIGTHNNDHNNYHNNNHNNPFGLFVGPLQANARLADWNFSSKT